MVGWGQINIKDPFSPAEAEVEAEFSNYLNIIKVSFMKKMQFDKVILTHMKDFIKILNLSII